MKSYHSDLANQINQSDVATITADNHKVPYVCEHNHDHSLANVLLQGLVYLYHHYLQGIIPGSIQHVISACPMIKV